MNRVLWADRAAYPAPVAPSLIDDDLSVRDAIRYGAELADTHTLSAAVTLVRINRSNILCTEHNRNSLCHGATHGQAVRAIAIAYSPDEGSVEGPYAVAKTVLFMTAQSSDGLVFAERLKSGCIRPIEKAFVKTTDDFTESSTVWCQTNPITVTFFSAECDVAADAGQTDNGVYKAENMLDILDRHYLPIMDFLHPSGDNPSEHAPYESWSLFKLIYTLNIPFECFSVRKESLDKPAPANIAQQVVGVITYLQIPLLALTMFQAELTHAVGLLDIQIPSQILLPGASLSIHLSISMTRKGSAHWRRAHIIRVQTFVRFNNPLRRMGRFPAHAANSFFINRMG